LASASATASRLEFTWHVAQVCAQLHSYHEPLGGGDRVPHAAHAPTDRVTIKKIKHTHRHLPIRSKTLSNAASPAPRAKRGRDWGSLLIIVAVIVIVGTVVFLLLPGDDEAVESNDDIDPDPVLCGELWATCATGDCCATGLVCRSGLCQYPGIVTKKLALYVDPSVAASYPGSGTTLFDLSDNRRDCTLQGGASVTDSVVALDGHPQYISTTHLPNLDLAYTFELWFWDDVPGITHDARTGLIGNYGAMNTVQFANVSFTPTGILSAGERNSAGVIVVVDGPSIVTGQWVRVVSSATATLLTLYVNGVQVGSVE